MKPLFNKQQIREWDVFTQKNEPIAGIDLMERAAFQAFTWITQHFSTLETFAVLVGPGNNGGDGLVMARLLGEAGYAVSVFLPETFTANSDAPAQFERLQKANKVVLDSLIAFNKNTPCTIIIDALLGTGINKAPHGEIAHAITEANQHNALKISVDIPSGLHADALELPEICLQAHYTLSFQTWKKVFLLPETGPNCGEIIDLPIGLLPEFEATQSMHEFMVTKSDIQRIYRKRSRFSYKGTYGHGLLLAGSEGKMGAAVLSARAALRGGIGLLTALLPDEQTSLFPFALPEAMTLSYTQASTISLDKFSAWAMGCGLGTDSAAFEQCERILEELPIPGILDADALNLISLYPVLWKKIPKGSLLTPHVGEFDRLFGKSQNHAERIEKAVYFAQEKNIFILLKGTYSALASPEGKIYYNTVGTPALAKAGSGDVLTGFLLALWAQYRNMEQAALLGMYIHGRAAQLAEEKIGTESVLAHETADAFGRVCMELQAH